MRKREAHTPEDSDAQYRVVGKEQLTVSSSGNEQACSYTS
jgi:hypothetical protein